MHYAELEIQLSYLINYLSHFDYIRRQNVYILIADNGVYYWYGWNHACAVTGKRRLIIIMHDLAFCLLFKPFIFELKKSQVCDLKVNIKRFKWRWTSLGYLPMLHLTAFNDALFWLTYWYLQSEKII